MTTNVETLCSILNQVLTQEAWLFAQQVPKADHLCAEDEPLNWHYYVRHRIETVRRIRETARTDALALACMIAEDYEAARKWAKYMEEEMNHDQLYLADLARHGLTEAQVLNVPPFSSTQQMLATLTQRVTELGSLPAVAYSIFAEWNSERASPLVVKRAEAAFSSNHVKGARAHIGIDERDDHYLMMLEVASTVLTKRQYSLEVLISLLREISVFLRIYFMDLYEYALAATGLPIVSTPQRTSEMYTRET